MSLITQEERDILFPGWKRGNGVPEPSEPRPRTRNAPTPPTNRNRRRNNSSNNKPSTSASNATSNRGDLTVPRHFELPIRPVRTSMPKGAIVSLIDIGVKFPQRYYNKNTDIRRYLARAAAAGVSHMIIIGSDYTTSQEALRICKEFDGCAGVILRCTVGIHPHNATQTFEKRVRKEVYEAQLRDEKHDLERGKRLGNLLRNTKVIRYETTKVNPTGKGIKSTNGSNSSDTPAEPTNGSNGGQSEANGNGTPAPQTVDQEWVILEAKYAKTFHTSLEKLITSPEGQKYCVAIGEIGLDYKAKSSAPDPLHQKQVFRKLLPLASKHNLPLYLHNRDAHSDFLSILKPFLSSTKAVVHCHTDPSLKNLKELLAAGVYVGFTGIVADNRVGNEEIVRGIPLDRMMIETNAPFLMPRNVPRELWGEKNEACLLPFVGKKIAQIRGPSCTVQEVAESTTRVAKGFFGF